MVVAMKTKKTGFSLKKLHYKTFSSSKLDDTVIFITVFFPRVKRYFAIHFSVFMQFIIPIIGPARLLLQIIVVVTVREMF